MCQEKKLIEVAIPIPVFTTFTYAVPEYLEEAAVVGKRVLVPLHHRRIVGYIIGTAEPDCGRDIKLILDILDDEPLFPSNMIPFFKWISEYYLHPIGEVIRCALPGGLTHSEDMILSLTQKGKNVLSSCEITPMQLSVLQKLETKPLSIKLLRKSMDSTSLFSLVYWLEKSGFIQIERILPKDTAVCKKETFVSILREPTSEDNISEQKLEILERVKTERLMPVKELKKLFPKSSSLLKPLERTGLISVFQKEVYRDPFGDSIMPDFPLMLSKDQQDVIDQLFQTIDKGFSAYLIAGVTGSGKTEVYLQAAAEIMKRGYSVIVLVPEIALISQTESRFRARFGDCVAVIHSGLSSGQRYDQWLRIVRKEAKIVVGARSAIFAPFDNLGLIIVDEEHDSSYKQETDLLYHARDLAVVRANQLGITVILGSATPSVQSLYNADIGKYQKISLTSRIESRPLPETTIIDLRKTRDVRGIRRFLTSELIQAIQDRLNRHEQSLIFLNRRGFATFPLCESCGSAIRCDHCDITLTYHQAANILKCHLCGFIKPFDSVCPTCRQSQIRLLGMGTEKLEAGLKKLFPEARIARMDRDTTSKKGSLLAILKDLKNNAIDMLVGTQMVTKGHDFPNITLVGIICADLSMNFPDFRACEQSFQLMAQVSGRAGRGGIPGQVILQTYNPKHFTILAAKDQDYQKFYHTEIKLRRSLNYPPFSRLVLIRFSGKEKDSVKHAALTIGTTCRNIKKAIPKFSDVIDIQGPVESFVSKIADRYRWQILIKGKTSEIVHLFIKAVMEHHSSLIRHKAVRIIIDVDPLCLM